MKKLSVPTDLSKLGFAPGSSDRKYLSLSVCSSGMEGSGKTDWACEAPEPVVVITFDPGTARIVAKKRQEGREIYESVVEMPEPGSAKEKNKQVYGPIWNQVEKQLKGLADSDSMSGGTVVVDTATELRELARLAILGKLKQVGQFSYGDVNDALRPLCKRIVNRADLNSIWIHKVKKAYSKGSDGNSHWTGKYERSGFDDLRYICDLIVEHRFNQKKKRFEVVVVTNKEYMDMSGDVIVSERDEADSELVDPASFLGIVLETFEDTEIEDWV